MKRVVGLLMVIGLLGACNQTLQNGPQISNNTVPQSLGPNPNSNAEAGNTLLNLQADVVIEQLDASYRACGNNANYGQTFTATATGEITSIAVAPASNVGEITRTLTVRSGDRATVLHSQQVTLTDSGGAFVAIPLSSPVPVSSGQGYAFDIDVNCAEGTGFYTAAQGTNPYSGGFAYSGDLNYHASLGFRITISSIPDTTSPTITLTTPTDGATYLLNQAVSAAYSCADEEGGSGVKTCEGTVPSGSAIDTSSVGKKTFTVTSSDNAGNPSSKTVTYTVTYDFSGFSAPVNNLPTLNTAKAGQAIPLKWRLTDASGAPVTTLSNVQVGVSNLSCSTGSGSDTIEEYVTSTSGLQNLGDGYYQYNWKTSKSYAGSCKTLLLNLGEGSPRTALFQFK